MELTIGATAIVAFLITSAAVRVSRIAPWRSVAMIAVSTGSLSACVAFIQHCERLQPNDRL